VNKPDANGVTPLQMAAMEGHVHIARYLIEQGARVNSRSNKDVTPLHWAAENIRLDVVQLLLQ
ncbi:ankyrin repeat-containing domain protein, partial [Diaporthe sp. PMI_573]